MKGANMLAETLNALATASQNSVVLDFPPWSGVRKRPSA